MASSEIIVIDDSSDDEAPRPTAAAARSTAAGGGASSKRARVDPTSTTPADVPAIITPSFAGASTCTAAASANNAHSAASAACAASTQSPLTGSGVATTSAKKRPSPTLGHEARLLDPALQRADGSGTSKSSQEGIVEISDPRHTIVDILGNCHAKVSFGAGRGPMPPNAIMGLPGLSVHGVGPVSTNDTWEYI